MPDRDRLEVKKGIQDYTEEAPASSGTGSSWRGAKDPLRDNGGAVVVVAAAFILFDPIFQGLAIALMAGEAASLALSRMTVPIVYFMVNRRRKAA
jgi:hypothetical protein